MKNIKAGHMAIQNLKYMASASEGEQKHECKWFLRHATKETFEIQFLICIGINLGRK